MATAESIIQLKEGGARQNRQPIAVELKIDTGFGRLGGAAPQEAVKLARLIKNTPWLRLQGGVFTHFLPPSMIQVSRNGS